jgi:hypothetical protein
VSQDFITTLQLQLREAALRDERRGPVATRLVRARRELPGPAPVAAALAVALLALAVALGAGALRGKPEPADPAPRVVAVEQVAGGLQYLAPGFGSAWSFDAAGRAVVRIDQATRRVVARIPVAGDAVVATGAGAVWALAGDLLYAGDEGPVELLRIDPRTNRVVARIPIRAPGGARISPNGLQVRAGVVLVTGYEATLRIDPRRNVPAALIATGRDPRGIVLDGDDLWVLPRSGTLRRFDVRTGRAEDRRPIIGPGDARLFPGAYGGLIASGAPGIVGRLDPANRRLVWQAKMSAPVFGALAVRDRVWVHLRRGDHDELVVLDAASGRKRGELTLPAPGVSGIAQVGEELWVATPTGKLVVIRGGGR